jgi:hypothetical protein
MFGFIIPFPLRPPFAQTAEAAKLWLFLDYISRLPERFRLHHTKARCQKEISWQFLPSLVQELAGIGRITAPPAKLNP